MLKCNGGWCWFQDPRAIVDGDRIIFGSVAGATAPGSARGDIDITSFDISDGTSTTFTLSPAFQSDDHDAPAILKLTDGRYLAVYQGHAADRLMRWRISEKPGDGSDWQAERSLDVGARNTYANLFRLAGEGGRIYSFHRGVGFNPNYAISDDDGRTFRYGGRLLSWQHPAQNPGSGRPYVRYAGNGVDTIHFIATEDHPHHFANSIYYGYYRAGILHRGDGAIVGPLSPTDETSIGPASFTRVFAGDVNNVAWTSDITLDAAGNPVIAFSVDRRRSLDDQDGRDLRYWYGRLVDGKWQVYEAAYAGSCLYEREFSYTGLAAIDPNDVNTVVISTNADPTTGDPLISRADGRRHWEIYRGVTADCGASWKWTALTKNSSQDNLRPIVPRSPGRRAILWLRGTYRAYTDYNLDVVGLIESAR